MESVKNFAASVLWMVFVAILATVIAAISLVYAEMNPMPIPVTNLATLGTVPSAPDHNETVEEFDARLGVVSNILGSEQIMGNLSPDEYNADQIILYQIRQRERGLRAAQSGFLWTSQLDEGMLEQVEVQLDQISVN